MCFGEVRESVVVEAFEQSDDPLRRARLQRVHVRGAGGDVDTV
jgi:hypothetical protein